MGPKVLYFDDLEIGAVLEAGPCMISPETLDRALALTGEHHPVHSRSDFAASTPMRERVVPGTLVHMLVEARLNAEHGAPARVGPARMHTDYLSPVHPGDMCLVKARATAKGEPSGGVGTVSWTRTITRDDGTVVAVARITESVLTRGPAERSGPAGRR